MFQTTDISVNGVGWGLEHLKSNLRQDMERLTFPELVASGSAPPFYQVLAFVYEVRKNCDAHQQTYGSTDLTFNANLQARTALLLMKAAQKRLVRESIHQHLADLHRQIEGQKMQILEGMFRMHELTIGRTILHV